MPLDSDAADRAADVGGRPEEEGAGIGMAGSLMAGIVLQRQAIFLASNHYHFERMPGAFLSTLNLT